MTAPVLPPDPEREGWHWLRDPEGGRHVAKWAMSHWRDDAGKFSSAGIAIAGWSYLCPIPSAEELASARIERDALRAEVDALHARIAELTTALDEATGKIVP